MCEKPTEIIHYELSGDRCGLLGHHGDDNHHHIHSNELTLAEKHVVVNLGGKCSYSDCIDGHVGDGEDGNGSRCPVCNFVKK